MRVQTMRDGNHREFRAKLLTRCAAGGKKRDFIVRVRASFEQESNVDFTMAIDAVFKLLDKHVSHGEIVQVRNSTKKSLRELWPVY